MNTGRFSHSPTNKTRNKQCFEKLTFKEIHLLLNLENFIFMRMKVSKLKIVMLALEGDKNGISVVTNYT